MTMLAKVPRAFILAGSIITFIIIYTQFYVDYDSTTSRYITSLDYSQTTNQVINTITHLNGFLSDDDEVADEADLGTTAGDEIVEESKMATDTMEAEREGNVGSGKAAAHAPQTPGSGDTPTKSAPLGGSDDIAKDYEFLVRGTSGWNLTDKVHFTRKCIKTTFSKSVDREEVAEIGHSLVNGSVEVDLKNTKAAQTAKCETIKLTVPQKYPTGDLSHIIFGVSTDLQRLSESRSAFEHWLSNTGAKLIAVVTDFGHQSIENITKVEKDFHAAHIDATLVKPLSADFTVSQNHFAVIVDLVNHADDKTKWFGLIDDDTFMPDLYPFVDALATIDDTEDAYVGQLSEDFKAVQLFGFMAFGGAGAYFSAPLARKLAPKALKCIHEATSGEGDIIIRDCVYAHSKAKLTMLDGLWQQDMKTDVSGFFEAGIKPLVLHHWKSWYKEPMAHMALSSKFCGDCFLQRFQFEDDTVFTNGYSIVTYPRGMHDVDLNLMEGTWDQAGRDYDFSVGPLRDKLPLDRKKSYKLKHAEITPKGQLKQLYVYYAPRIPEEPKPEDLEEEGGEEAEPAPALARREELTIDNMLDEVIELTWSL